MGITQCAEICPFKTASGWCGLTGCIRRHTTTEISANSVLVIPDDYVKVVRCRDCKYFEFISDRPVRHGNCKISDDKWAEDSFCSAGERKKIDGRMKND